MENAAVLDIAAFADLDDVVVGPQDGAEPNAGLARESERCRSATAPGAIQYSPSGGRSGDV